jgi:RecQ family ATP-dependent DNA helicase
LKLEQTRQEINETRASEAVSIARTFTELLNQSFTPTCDEDEVEESDDEDTNSASFRQVVKSTSLENFRKRYVNERKFLMANINEEHNDEIIDYNHFKVPENFHMCCQCFKSFDTEKHIKSVALCGHSLCKFCSDELEFHPCKSCVSYFDYREQGFQTINPVDNDPKWLFNDIKDMRSRYSGRYAHDTLVEEKLATFNISDFRYGQREIINAVMCSHDVFVLMSSGGGKSLTFQLPATLCKGFFLVISPLVSLIEDQVRCMTELGIKAVHLSNEVFNYKEILEDLQKQQPTNKLVYVTPEKFKGRKFSEDMRSLSLNGQVCRVVIDEAHVLPQWGLDFRRTFLKMDQILKDFLPDIPVAIYSASASVETRLSILSILDLPDNRRMNYFLSSFDRPNLQYRMERIEATEQQFEKAIEYCLTMQLKKFPGIIYCVAKTTCDELCDRLISSGIAAAPYHSGLAYECKSSNLLKWIKGEIRVIVATIAFGLGINKPDVRFLIHVGTPKSIEGYYQETGRAGRDGKYAICVLLHGGGDYGRWKKFIASKKEETIKKNKGNATLIKLAHENYNCQYDAITAMNNFKSTSLECTRKQMLRYFGQDYDTNKCLYNFQTACDNCRKVKYNSHDPLRFLEKLKNQN